MKVPAKRRVGLPLMIAIVLATLLPPAVPLAITYLEALHTAEAALEQTVAGSIRRTNWLLGRSDAALHTFVAETNSASNETCARVVIFHTITAG